MTSWEVVVLHPFLLLPLRPFLHFTPRVLVLGPFLPLPRRPIQLLTLRAAEAMPAEPERSTHSHREGPFLTPVWRSVPAAPTRRNPRRFPADAPREAPALVGPLEEHTVLR